MNHMEEVAKMLGVKLGDRFKIYGERFKAVDGVFHINEKGLIDGDSRTWSGVLIRLITGEYTIEKLPWKPKDGELYFSGRMDGGIIRQYWNGNHYDYALYFVGNCFRTSEDAKHASKIVDKLRRKYEGGGE